MFQLRQHANIAYMGQIVVSNKEKSIIGTEALATCYGIVFYDRKNKFGMVGHGTPLTKLSTLEEMLKMLGDEQRTIECTIVDGYRNIQMQDHTGLDEIMKYLQIHCPKNIKLIPFQSNLGIKLNSNETSYQFAFEVNTGLSVSNYVFYDNISRKDSKLHR